MKFATLISALAFCTATFAHADIGFSKNENYKDNQVSADIQGFGNRVLDQVGKSKYIKFDQQKTEYAYRIKRLSEGDIKYTGNKSDIKGIIFIEVTEYKDGLELPEQVSTFTPSKYNNAIKILKMDRNDERPYEFDLGMDSDSKLYLINENGSTVPLQQVNAIKRYIPLTEKHKDMIF
ncbi:MAG: hypothetical protein JHC54_00160 [Acinetobacter sp.]|nr:hypothetical protein [Acinetobacter sp.]